MTGDEALTWAARQLAAAGIEDPRRDARWLLAHALGKETGAISRRDEPLPSDAESRLEAAVAARARHQPISQITGRRAFYGREFRVTSDVLDPRADTETLVDVALAEPFATVLDLGTGSGAILVTLLAERLEARGHGTDLSEAALGIARANAERHGVAARASFRPGDWYAAIDGRFDLIVSNPPYIAADEMAGLQPEVREWEPRLALTDEGDGLSAYRAIAAGVADHLRPGGRLIVETGHRQGDAVSAIFRSAGLESVARHTDLSGNQRAVSARKP